MEFIAADKTYFSTALRSVGVYRLPGRRSKRAPPPAESASSGVYSLPGGPHSVEPFIAAFGAFAGVTLKRIQVQAGFLALLLVAL